MSNTGHGAKQGGWGGSWGTGRAACLVFLLVGATPAAGAAQSLLDRPAGLAIEREPIEAALRLLQRSAGVPLVYSPDLLPADRLVSCACARVPVGEALDTILRDSGFTYRAADTQIRIVPAERAPRATLYGVVVGRVVDEESGRPVGNVMVQIAGGAGVLTHSDGSFVIRRVPKGHHRLLVTALGWLARGVDSVRVDGADTARTLVRVRPSAVPLAEIRVAPGAVGMLEEVPPATVHTRTREEMETLPQLGEDVFRGLKRLPGVASHDISTKLAVRGGLDREVAVRLDGMELYEPYHMKDWDGALGIVDLNALGGIELRGGGFGVEHGDKLTGILDMTSRTRVAEARTDLGLSVSSITASGRGGFADERGAWLVSGRRGFMDLILRMIGEDQRLSPAYYDVFGKVSYQAGPRHLLSAHVLQAGDAFRLRDRVTPGIDEVDLETGYDSSYGWLTWRASPGARLSTTTTAWTGRVTGERDGLVVDAGRVGMPESMDVFDRRVFTFAGLRHDLGYALNPDLLLKLGGELQVGRTTYDYSSSVYTPILTDDGHAALRLDTASVHLDPRGTEAGVWAAARARPVQRFVAEFGLRYDRVSHTDDRDVSPRVLTSFELTPRTTFRASWGRYHQSHGIHELRVGDRETEFHGSERADQVAVGLEHRLPDDTDLRLELYRRIMDDPSPRFLNLEQELEIFPELEGDRLRIDPVEARAEGLELTVERRTGRRWAWSASYALAVAEDRLPEDSPLSCADQPTCSDGSWIPRRYDQRHTLTFQAAYRPSDRTNVSLRWVYHSGWPATEWTFDARRLDDGSVFWSRTFGPLREERLPSYQRLDVRVNRVFTVKGRPLHVYLDLFNLFDRTNLASYYFEGTFENGRVFTERVDGQTMLPRLPTIGFRYEF